MTMTESLPEAPQAIELHRGEQASIPVPEGRVTIVNETFPNDGRTQAVVILYPHGDAAPHELVRFAAASFDISQMVLVALAALDSWR